MVAQIKGALAAQPDNEPLLFNLGMLRWQQAQARRDGGGDDDDQVLVQEAVDAFSRAVKLNPTRDASWFQLGTLHRAAGRVDAAVDVFQMAMEATASEEVAIAASSNLVALLLGERRLDDAAKVTDAAVNRYPHSAVAWTNMGIVLRENRSNDWAQRAFETAIQCDPRGAACAVAYNNLGNIAWERGDVRQALTMYAAALAADPGDEASCYNLALLQREAGDVAQAESLFERCLALNPANAAAKFQLAALRGPSSSSSGSVGGEAECPSGYISDLFDHYARVGYEQHVLQELRYKGPDLMWAAYAAAGPLPRPRVVVDLGMGTGLVGKRFREGLCDDDDAGAASVAEFWGCDLSSEMVVNAYELTWGDTEPSRASPVYSDVAVADCVEYLEQRSGGGAAGMVDLVLAGDVLNYVGRLDRLLSAAQAALVPGTGVFVFTVEKKCDGGDGYALQPSARFAHSEGYLRRSAAAAGLDVASLTEVPDLRTEGGKPVAGYIVVLRRPL
jgi:predicted TPR repeat methyltransferase